MKVNKLLTPYNYTGGKLSRIQYIVLHYVGATGGAEANCKYYASRYIGASAHYYVDFDGSIWQSVADENIAWHCGRKDGIYRHPECRNSNSIGIEMCVRNRGNKEGDSRDWYFEDATVTAAIRLTKELMVQYGVPSDHVIRHYDVTGKICPNPFVYNHTKHTWNKFKEAISDLNRKTYPVSTDKAGLSITASALNIREYPPDGRIAGSYKKGEAIFPLEKTFVDGKAWYRTDRGWICASYVQGWVLEDNGRWWYVMPGCTFTVNDWQLIDGTWYYFDHTGYMVESAWIQYKGEDYYMMKGGGMAADCYVKSADKELYYWVNGDGKWIPDTSAPDFARYKVVI